MDPLLIGLIVILALFMFMQFRSSKKRREQQEEMNTKMVPGAEIMTQFGLFGTLLSIDDDSNEALVETTPGVIVRVHRQVIMKVVEDETDTESSLDDADDALTDGTDTESTDKGDETR